MDAKPVAAVTAKKPSRSLLVLAANLQALIDHAEATGGEFNSQPKVAKKAKVDQKTVWRIINKVPNEPSLDKVEKLAKVFSLDAWQLLVPGLDPAARPALSTEEAETVA